MSKNVKKQPVTFDRWCAIQAPDGDAYVIGRHAGFLPRHTARLPSGKMGFAELRRWCLVGPIVVTDLEVTIMGTSAGQLYRLGEPVRAEDLDRKVWAALAFDLSIIGIEDSTMPVEVILRALDEVQEGVA